MLKPAVLALALASVATAALAQAAPGYPKIIPAPGGEVVIHSEGAQRNYDAYKFAPARRAGDFLYISGVIAGPYGQPPTDHAAFTEQVKRAFRAIDQMLKAEGLT